MVLDDVLQRYNVDPKRVYLTGISMGGYGAWDFASRYPEYFAAVAPYLLPATVRELRARVVAGDAALCRITGSVFGFGAAVRGAAGVIVKEVFADPGRVER